MTCDEVDNRLPAYLEDILSPEEKKNMEGHMADCLRCSRAFADMKKTEELLQSLGAVEPPPFFEQRIMSRVREEAGRRQGILRKLFYPLYIKIPIQAMATILIAVLGFYVYERGEPEMRQRAPLPIPLRELERGKDTTASPQAPTDPSAVARAKRSPAGDFSEKTRQRPFAPPIEKGGIADRTAEAPVKAVHPTAMKPALQAGETEVKEIRPAMPEILSNAQDKAGKQELGRSFEAPSPEQKRTRRMAGTGTAAEENGKATFPTAPSRSAVEAAIDLTIKVGDTSAAVQEIVARLGQFNARIIDRRHREGKGYLEAEMPVRDVAAFLDRIDRIGRVNLEKSPPGVPDGKVTIRIKIISHP